MQTPMNGETPLVPGAMAPKFQVSRFFKGQPVDALAPGQVYVLEFWATWCGPCIESIPHISALQAAHPDVVFIGVAIDTEKAVEEFMTTAGERMAYRVAVDLPLPAAEGSSQGWMRLNWLAAADRMAIPDAFIVDGEGRIAWIGDPHEIGDVLPLIRDKSWDIAEFQRAFSAQAEDARQMRERLAGLAAASEDGDWPAVVAQCDALLASPTGMEPMLVSERFKALGHLDPARAHDYAEAEFDKARGRQGLSMHMALARACRELASSLAAAGNPTRAAEFFRSGLRYIDAVQSSFDDFRKLDPQSASAFQTVKILEERAALLEANGRPAEAASDAKACIALLVAQGEGDFADMIKPLRDLIARCLGTPPEEEAAHSGGSETKRGATTVICDGDVCRIVTS